MCDDQVKILANNVPGKFWAPSRKVWNQFSYFNVNINDDLSIPMQQQKHNLPGDQIEYNTFLKQNALPKSPVADAKLTIQDFTCNQNGVEITLEICNDGDNLLSSITPITFYQKNPTNSNAVILDIQDIGVTIPTGSCEEIMYNINFTGNDSIFIVVNDDGSRVRPFSFDDFPITTFPECDYLNNMDGIYLERQNLSVNLGPDIEVCDNGVWVLDAGLGFEEYRWSNASLEQTITVWEPGIYWVEVVGDCGSLLRDTIEISIIPTTQIELPDDMIVCLGDSVELFVSNFNSYKWWSTSPLVCDTCNSIKLFPIQTDTIIVLVQNGDACYSTDSLIIELDSFITIEDQVTLCEGDTLLYYDQIITEEGKYEHILNAINACDTLDVLNVELLEDLNLL